MKAQAENVVTLLNKLVELINERITAYKQALNETRDLALGAVFSLHMVESQNIKRDLCDEIVELGGVPVEIEPGSTKWMRVKMDLKRLWIDFTALFGKKDAKDVVNSCEYEEKKVLKAYNRIMKSGFRLPMNILESLMMQQEKIQNTLIDIRNLKNYVAS